MTPSLSRIFRIFALLFPRSFRRVTMRATVVSLLGLAASVLAARPQGLHKMTAKKNARSLKHDRARVSQVNSAPPSKK